MPDWENYYKKHISRKPREQLVKAVNLCFKKENALDLGAGTLIESKFLLKSGFKKVVAVDNSPETKVFAKKINSKKFILKISSFEDFKFSKNKYDLISAQYSLPFYGPKNFKNFIKKIKDSLKLNGIFTGQLFGVNDEWNVKRRELVFQNREQALKLLSGLKILEFKEEEKDIKITSGISKHQHIFHFIAEK